MTGFFAEGQWWDVTTDDHHAIVHGAALLSSAGIDNSLQEARTLFADAQGHAVRFQILLQRRAAREPMSHLLGYRDFYKHRFKVTPDVLDPRPETEVLVIEALKLPFRNVLDLGTGSGCILLSLLAENRGASGVGTDMSQAALAVAQENSQSLDLSSRAAFHHSSWFSAVAGPFDLIVSNPPYIALDEMADLGPEVRDYEPRIALTDEGDGLACYREIIEGAPLHLLDQGHLIIEIGPTQAAEVSEIMAVHGFGTIQVIPDLDGRDRVVKGQFRA